MTLLVTVKDNAIAFGKNELEQIVIDIGGISGILPNPVGTFALLPTIWNGQGAPETGEGTLAVVEGDSSAGLYQYVGTRSALQAGIPTDFLIDEWIRSELYQRGLVFLIDSVQGAPLFFSRPAGDDLATITTLRRSWQVALTGGSTVTEVGVAGDQPVNTEAFRMTAQTGNLVEASLTFGDIVLHETLPTIFLVYGFRSGGVSNSAVPGMAAIVVLDDGNATINTSFNSGNPFAGSQIGFYSDIAAAGPRGHGSLIFNGPAPWQRTDIEGQLGTDPLDANPLQEGSGNWQAFSAARGKRIGSLAALTYDQGDYVGGVPTVGSIRLLSQNGTADVTSFDVTKVVGLRTLV